MEQTRTEFSGLAAESWHPEPASGSWWKCWPGSAKRPAASGEMRVAGDAYNATREEMRRHKMPLLPEEPLKNACIGAMSVADNIAFREFDRAPFATAGG
ncbi:MAG: transporter ATP-binding protein [Tardiphaga sp.]|nr:transporter ATP-binding protein [Tardiphaga sp.]